MSWTWCGTRHGMKLKDKAIAEERQLERQNESEPPESNPPKETINHFLHPHRLTYTGTKNSEFWCNACNLRGNKTRYHCPECKFNLHIICTQTPLTWLLPDKPVDEIKTLVLYQQNPIHGSFAHPGHSLVAEYRTQSFKCDHCQNSGEGLRFVCNVCNVMVHQLCAKNPTRLTTYLHEHELEFKIRPHFQKCHLCDEKGLKNNFMYKCKRCWFYVHPDCCEWPLYVVHPLHLEHPLVLQYCSGHTYNCSICNWKIDGYKYSCPVCKLDFDPGCIYRKAQIHLDEEIREKYRDQIIMLPIKNLSSPYELSVSHLDELSPVFIDPTFMVAPFIF